MGLGPVFDPLIKVIDTKYGITRGTVMNFYAASPSENLRNRQWNPDCFPENHCEQDRKLRQVIP